jgi:hypothetical protein
LLDKALDQTPPWNSLANTGWRSFLDEVLKIT